MKSLRAPQASEASSRLLMCLRIAGPCSALVWWLCLKAYASRWVALLNYGATAVVSPTLEPLAPLPWPTLWVSLGCLLGWIGLSETLWRNSHTAMSDQRKHWTWAIIWLTGASVPWLIDLSIHRHQVEALTQAVGLWGPSLWQPLWFSVFSGLAVDRFMRALGQGSASRKTPVDSTGAPRSGGWSGLVLIASFLCGVWWFTQSQHAYDRFMLGFNDCGHFAQRIANTAAGRGWLIESPVLPAFWDHFNPGLTLLVPLWWLWPHMSLFFFLQALSLAGCAPLVMHLARLLGAGAPAASIWALAWLTQPVLGQMNLAYSYGWHPISLAIPLLLAALCCILERRWKGAAACAVLAASFEEGVLVIIATTAATLAAFELLAWWRGRKSIDPTLHPRTSVGGSYIQCSTARRVSAVLSARAWIGVALVSTLAFVAIFRFSGLAQFQTGRFHTLGRSALEILLSPINRPQAFWGLLLRSRNAVFLAGLLIPSYLPALARAWPLLLPAALPLCVLLVWDHLPAQSLAFHYPSTLLPVIWLAALAGATARRPAAERHAALDKRAEDSVITSQRTDWSWSMGWAALATSVVACFSFGQMPWSSDTIYDIDAVTFGVQRTHHREVGSADNQFAHEQLAEIRAYPRRILATGRFATHLVGASDLETVGQFFERRESLAKFDPAQHPLRRYEVLIFDRLENFQQRPEQTSELENEALANGFRKKADQYDIVVLERD